MAARKRFPELSRCIYHSTVFAVYAWTVYYDLLYMDMESHHTYGGRFKFLTFINLLLQTFFFGFSLLNDFCGSNTKSWDDNRKRSPLQKLRDLIVASVIFPIGVFVVLTFWGLYAIDRELVYPKALDSVVPLWLNHVMHTTVLVFLLLEKYFVYHHYPRRPVGLLCTVGFALVYQLWILWIAYRADIWVYPILQVLNWPMRIFFFFVCWSIIIAIYLCGEAITNRVWRPTKQIHLDKQD